MLDKMNRKGFTLVELLVVIAVIALVLGLTSYGIIGVLNNSKGKAINTSIEGIVAAGKLYSSEKTNDNSYWRDIPKHEDKYFCVTIEELINKGLLKKDGKLPDNIKINNYVMIKKNKVTSTIGNGEIIANDEIDNVCTGTILKEKLKYPSILSSNKYTDKVSINFKDTICEKDCDDFSIDKSKTECLYGDSSGLLNMKGTISGNTCSISGLKSSETYYARICQTTLKGSYVCSTTDGYTTDKVKEPNITIKNVGANINYDTAGISGVATFSFMSTISAFVKDSNGNDIITAEANKWYNVNKNDITLHFRSNGNGIVYAKTTDSSGNVGESNKKYNVYSVLFNIGDADRLEGGATNGISVMCVSEEKGKCKIKAPSFEKNNFTVLGWNTLKTASESSWSIDEVKEINKNAVYYPIFKSSVKIKYSVNGGTITSATPSDNPTKFWKTTSTGIIQKSTSLNGNYADYYQSIDNNKIIETDGLVNYNNTNSINISRAGYKATSGSEWICMSGCTSSNKTFSQASNTDYKSTDFCNTANGNCSVVLGVNWVPNTYTISYNANGGNGAPSAQTKIHGTDLTLSSSIPIWAGHTFLGWSTSNGATSATYSDGGTYKENNTATLYAVWRVNKVRIRYNTNGGSIATTSNSSGTWGKDSSNRVTHNGSLFEYTINYGSSNDLHNWNNSDGINISKSNYTALSGAEWICKSGCPSGKKYNHSTIYSSNEFCDASNGDCTVEVQVNWRLNQVHVRYNTNGGSIATTSNSNGTWSKDSSNYVYKNGSVFEQIIDYGSSSDPWNYNNSNGINISRSGYKAISGSEWKCTSGCSSSDKVFNQDTTYASTTYCDASKGDCTIVLGVNWIQDCTTYYVIEPDGLNCRNGASTSYGIKTVFTCGTSLKVCSSSTNGWYYDSNKGCYVSGDYIRTYRPSSCAQTGGGGGSYVSCSSYKYCRSDNRIGDDSCRSYSNFAGSSAGACFIYNPCNCPSNFTGTNSCEDYTGRGGC